MKIGDSVMVVGNTLDFKDRDAELIPIGTVCKIIEIDLKDKDGLCYKIASNTSVQNGYCKSVWYPRKSLQKGEMVWVPIGKKAEIIMKFDEDEEYPYGTYPFNTVEEQEKVDKLCKQISEQRMCFTYIREIADEES